MTYLSNFHYIACSSASSGCATFKGFLIQGNSSGGFRKLKISMKMPENTNLKGRSHISTSFSLNLAPDREACAWCAIWWICHCMFSPRFFLPSINGSSNRTYLGLISFQIQIYCNYSYIGHPT